MVLYRQTNHQPTVILAVILFFWVASFPFPCLAKQPKRSPVDRIQQEIFKQKAKIKSSKEHELNIHKELQRMDNELKIGQQKLTFFQERLLRQEGHIQQKEAEISILQAEKDSVGEHVGKRLRSFYQMDEISIINTLFSASTLPELLNLKQYFQAMFQYDLGILQNYSTKISLLADAQTEIAKEKQKLLEVIIEQKNQEKILIAARLARSSLLARVQTEEKLYRHALTEIKIAADKLVEKINSLHVKVIRAKKRKIASFKSNKKNRPSDKNDFSSMQGKLSPPAPGTVIKYFGTYVDRFDTETVSSGINIDTPHKTKIKAIYPGTVVFSGIMTSFGNLVIIDHGWQYHSLVSGLESILVEKGSQVIASQTIGIMGSGATLLSKGLHFEIRLDSYPVDPLLWLDTRTLALTDQQYRFQ